MGATERMKEYIESKGVTKYKFSQITGLSNSFLNNSSNMGTDKAEIILSHYPDLSPEWLLTGRGPMLREGSSTPDTPAATQPPAEQASPIKIPSSQSDARQLAIHVLDHVKELEQQPIFMSYIKQKAYEIALDIVTEKLSK